MLSDFELTQKLKTLASQERQLTSLVVEHIAEVDRRKLFLGMAYASLFDYLTKEIGYSAGSAHRRIDAARLLQRIPEVSAEIANGSVHLGQISKLQQACRQMKKETSANVPVARQKQIFEKLKNKNNDQTDLIIAQELNVQVKIAEIKHTQRDESVRIELTFSKEEMAVIQKARELLSNKTGGSLKDTILEMARKVISESTPSTSTVEVIKKSITPKLKREILSRDQHCQFRSTSGKACGSRYFLEVDHVHPKYAGGTNETNNLRALCKNHNQYRYRVGL